MARTISHVDEASGCQEPCRSAEAGSTTLGGVMEQLTVSVGQAQQTLAALLRLQLPNQTWNQVRRLVAARRVKVNGEVCFDPARRLKEGDVVELAERPAPKPRQFEA